MKTISFFLCFLSLLLSACGGRGDRLELSAVSFDDLSGWEKEKPSEALAPLLRSCAVFDKKSSRATLKFEEAGTMEDWRAPCQEAREMDSSDDAQARAFFERNFTPYKITNEKNGLFTGYFEAALNGSLTRGGKYQTPIWAVPQDLITADLGTFKEALKGQKIVGKVEGSQFVPYDRRTAIAGGSLNNRAEALVWVDDPVAAFFLEIQGSGRVQLETGQEMRLGYAAQNGHAYTAIGRVLAEGGEIAKPVTMAKIKEWFARNPLRQQEIMNQNPSAIFFKTLEGEGPVGAMGIALTPLRSLAVDPKYVPLGVPLWLESAKHQRLVVAQDTGGAIKGPVRGDLFWGYGQAAEQGAGEMQESGTYYLLLPKKTSKR